MTGEKGSALPLIIGWTVSQLGCEFSRHAGHCCRTIGSSPSPFAANKNAARAPWRATRTAFQTNEVKAMATVLKPQGRRWTMPQVTQWADEWIANHGAGYASGLAAAHGAELTIRAMLAVERIVVEHDVAIFEQEVVLAWNRMAQAERTEERYRHAAFIDEYAGAR